MREISVRIFDDLDYARDRSRNEAAVTVTIGLDGVWREYWGPRPGHVACRVPVELLWPHELTVNGGLTDKGATCNKAVTGESHGGSHS